MVLYFLWKPLNMMCRFRQSWSSWIEKLLLSVIQDTMYGKSNHLKVFGSLVRFLLGRMFSWNLYETSQKQFQMISLYFLSSWSCTGLKRQIKPVWIMISNCLFIFPLILLDLLCVWASWNVKMSALKQGGSWSQIVY